MNTCNKTGQDKKKILLGKKMKTKVEIKQWFKKMMEALWTI